LPDVALERKYQSLKKTVIKTRELAISELVRSIASRPD
jgi:hypothetical protein